MNLKSIKISNILTFEHQDDINNATEIIFDEKLNILIGANASGKSNFLEIINALFKSILILDCNFNEGIFEAHKNDPSRNPLSSVLSQKISYHQLSPNHKSDTTEQRIKIKLQLEEGDFENLEFLINNLTEINETLQKYSTNLPSFTESVTIDQIKQQEIVEFTFGGNPGNKTMSLLDDFSNNDVLRLIYFYFYYFKFFQNAILLANRFEEKNWKPLNVIFSLISGYRNYDRINDTYQVQPNKFEKLQPIYNNIQEESTRKSNEKEPAIFELTRHKLSYELDEIEFQMGNNELQNFQGKKSFEILQATSEIYTEINNLLESNLKIRLVIHRQKHSSNYQFVFVDSVTEKTIDVFELSSGEKGLIHFICSLFGYDMKNGVMIIDEPELHLHPQIQSKYLDIINDVRIKLGIQFIFATHSPMFINSKTIQSVYRFYKDDGITKIIKPEINDPERDLIHFLTFTNSSKIFFTNKVVLVEGDKDYYFFHYYLDNYKKRKNRDITDIEFLVINGKGGFTKWKNFLDKYKIETYYIGDLDNLLLDSISANANSLKTKYGNILRLPQITTIKSNNLSDYQNIQYEISENYSKGLFLISNGSLEDNLERYIGKKPEFDDVINFCRNEFENWITTTSDPFISEIDYFMHLITRYHR